MKSEKAVDLNNVLESSGKTTDPAAAGQVCLVLEIQGKFRRGNSSHLKKSFRRV